MIPSITINNFCTLIKSMLTLVGSLPNLISVIGKTLINLIKFSRFWSHPETESP